METVLIVIDAISDVLTIGASAIAIYLFWSQREKIKRVIDLVLNYSMQLTLSELKYKIEKLNDFHIPSDQDIVINILKEIEGQIRGNKTLRIELKPMLDDIQAFTDKPAKITEGRKRSLVAELKESLRHPDVANYKKIV